MKTAITDLVTPNTPNQNTNTTITQNQVQQNATTPPIQPRVVHINQRNQTKKQWDTWWNSKLQNKHYRNLEKINKLYKIANALDDKYSVQMTQCINACKEDIEIAPAFVQLCISCNEPIPVEYGSFKRLAIIYDKRKEYNKAIDICTQALYLGFTNNGDMYNRLSRLLKKSNGGVTLEQYLSEHGLMLEY